MDSKKDNLAVLIDAENFPARHLRSVFKDINKLGVPAIRRIYGDWTRPNLSTWSDPINSLALLPIHQTSYVSSKNSSDITMVIEAMDLMHSATVSGICLCSSDSDFTRLAMRLREGGLKVFGFGEAKAPSAFQNACHTFTVLENTSATQKPSPCQKLSPSKYDRIKALAKHISDPAGNIHLSKLAQELKKEDPNFSPKIYGFKTYSALVNATKLFDISLNTPNTIRLKASLP